VERATTWARQDSRDGVVVLWARCIEAVLVDGVAEIQRKYIEQRYWPCRQRPKDCRQAYCT